MRVVVYLTSGQAVEVDLCLTCGCLFDLWSSYGVDHHHTCGCMFDLKSVVVLCFTCGHVVHHF